MPVTDGWTYGRTNGTEFIGPLSTLPGVQQESTYEFNKAFFKLLANCVYGKTMENIRKRINVKLINDCKGYVKCVSKPNFISQKIFDKNFIAVHQIKTVLTLNKPIYVGFCILELSKLLM